MREERKARKRNIFISLTRKASKREIWEKQKNEQRSLTREEKKEIVLKNARKARRTMVISILSVAIGGAGVFTLAAPKNNDKQEITEEAINQTNKENTNSDRKSFRERIDARDHVQQTEVEKNMQEAIQEVDSLETPDDVLNYLKDIYVAEYNEENLAQITKENVRLYIQDRLGEGDYNLYNDVSKNGDQIVRWSYNPGKKEGIGKDFIMAKVLDENKQLIDSDAIVYSGGVSRTAYSSEEQVDKYEDGTLVDIGNLMRQGLCYYSEMDNDIDPNSDRAKQAIVEYKNDFINAIAEYNNQKDNESVKSQEEVEEEK